MNIWMLESEVEDYDNLLTQPALSYDEMKSFDGRSHKDTWTPLYVERMEPEKGLKLGDAPGHIFPVFSKRALDCLSPLLKDSIEALPLAFNEGEFYVINVLTVLNAIDYEKAEYVMYSDGSRIMLFDKYAFRPDVVKGVPLFKIIDETSRNPFVSDEFKRVVEECGLEGFKFELVWTEDAQE